MIVPGLTGESHVVVEEGDLVSHPGGVRVGVLSTPRLIQHQEEAAVDAIAPSLPPGQLSLGTEVRIRHLAATPQGAKVTAHGLLKSVEKNRLLFVVDAHDEREKVAEGEPERIVVSEERFVQRVAEKKAGLGR